MSIAFECRRPWKQPGSSPNSLEPAAHAITHTLSELGNVSHSRREPGWSGLTSALVAIPADGDSDDVSRF